MFRTMRRAHYRVEARCGEGEVRCADGVWLCRHHFDPERTLMIGDRLNTDIEFGKSGGLGTLLVMTGMSFPAGSLVLE